MKLARLLLSMLILLTACSDDSNMEGVTPSPNVTTWEEPTTDQMAVRVTVDVPAVALSQFAEKSVGAALLKRLPNVSSVITDDTELVLLKGSDISSLSDATMSQVANVLAMGGYVAIERPTQRQLDNFMERMETALGDVMEDAVTELFGKCRPNRWRLLSKPLCRVGWPHAGQT